MIAYILDTFPSPSETFIAREIAALRRRGLAVEVWALHAGEGAATIERSTLARIAGRVENRRATAAKKSAGEWEKLGAAWWKREAANLATVRHFHGAWASHPAGIARGAARASGLPWSFSAHARDLWVDGRNLPQKLAQARFATACTRGGQAQLRALSPANAAKVLYAPHGLQVARFPFVAPVLTSDAPLKILVVGRLVAKKGVAVVLWALKQLPFEFHCVVIGDGPLRADLEAQCRRDGLSERVTWAGALSNEEVVEGMREADVLVHAGIVDGEGDRDGLPNVLLEAAAVGLPIVSSWAGSVGDAFDHTSARLCPPDDAAELARAIAEVRGDFATTVALCGEARRRIETLFESDENIEILAHAFGDSSIGRAKQTETISKVGISTPQSPAKR